MNLYKNGCAHGFKSGVAEIEFAESNSAGHMLNVFDTYDIGRIFIDDTGTKNGNGEDKIGFVEIGKPYGTLSIKSIINHTLAIDCNTDCRGFAKEITFSNISVFTYAFFDNIKQCMFLYNNCSRIFAIESTEKAEYSQEEQQKLFTHLQELYQYLVNTQLSQLSGNATTKQVQIYW